jgi:hypothetical protein
MLSGVHERRLCLFWIPEFGAVNMLPHLVVDSNVDERKIWSMLSWPMRASPRLNPAGLGGTSVHCGTGGSLAPHLSTPLYRTTLVCDT